MKATSPYIEGPTMPSFLTASEVKELELLSVEDWFLIGSELKLSGIDADAFWSQEADGDLIRAFNEINRKRTEACHKEPEKKEFFYTVASERKMI